jgi:hypothetical protein
MSTFNYTATGDSFPDHRSFLMPGWEGLYAFFSGYDFTPCRVEKYRHDFFDGASIKMDVMHFPKMMMFYFIVSPTLDLSNPRIDSEYDRWLAPVYDAEFGNARFDVNTGRRFTNNENLLVYYEPRRLT